MEQTREKQHVHEPGAVSCRSPKARAPTAKGFTGYKAFGTRIPADLLAWNRSWLLETENFPISAGKPL